MSIYRGSQKIKELRFGGSRKIKEAYVGRQLVYKGGWDASPVDGVMFTEAGAFVSYTNITFFALAKTWQIKAKEIGSITGIVFDANTTAFTVNLSVTYTRGLEFFIDGESIGIYNTQGVNTISIPTKFINDTSHTITIENRSTNTQSFSSMSFNV